MKKHETFRVWYKRMQDIILSNESNAKTKSQSNLDWLKPIVLETTDYHNCTPIKAEINEEMNASHKFSNTAVNMDERIPLRILATSFIALVAVFAYASSRF
jgi:hypothetical protein